MPAKQKCSVCKRQFTHKKPETLVGKLGIIPVQFCRKCYPLVLMQNDELELHDTRKRVG